MPNLVRSQASAARMIARWGKPGYLVREGVKRQCMIARQDYSPKERELYVDGAERMFVTAKGLAVPPDPDLDMIEWDGNRYRIQDPIKGPRPNGLVMFYDCQVVWIEKVA